MYYNKFKNLIDEFKSDFFDINKALILLQKMRLYYQVSKDIKLLSLSNDLIAYSYNKNNLDARLLLFKAYFDFLSNKDASAFKTLKVVNSGAKYYMANEKQIFYALTYVKARFSSNEKVKQKFIKVLLENATDSPLCFTYVADIYIYDNDYKNGYDLLSISQKKGVNASIFYENLYKIFLKGNVGINSDSNKMICVLLRWLIIKDIDYSKIVYNNIDNIKNIAYVDINLLTKIYDTINDDELLREIVAYYVKNENVSKKAWNYYFIANKKQIIVENLNKMFITASFHNDYDNISYFFMSTYIKENEISNDLKEFIFYLLVNNEHLVNLLDDLLNEFYLYIKSLFNKTCFSKYMLSSLKYTLLNISKFDFSKDEISFIETTILDNLFKYKIETVNVNFDKIVVIEHNKKNISSYDIVNNQAYIYSENSDFSYYLYDKNTNSIDSINVKVTPMILSLEIDIFIYLYKKGYYSDDLYIRLSNYFFEESPSSDHLYDMQKILEKTILIDNVSDVFVSKANMHLASINVINKDYIKASENIKNLDYKNFSTSFLEKMYYVYLKTGDFNKAHDILNFNYYKISESLILSTLSFLEKDADYALFSDIFYKTLANGITNIDLINVILKYYNFTFQEQLNMIPLLISNKIYSDIFFEKLMYNAISKKELNKEIEEYFSTFFSENVNAEIAEQYIIFLFYKMIKDDYTLLKETVDFVKLNKDITDFSYYILFLYYNEYGTSDINSFKNVLEYLESKDIILPSENKMEKYYKDFTFFRKYHVFSYSAPKGENIFLNYNINNSTYKKIKMDYFHFSLYTAKIMLFFDDKVDYFYSIESTSGSVETGISTFTQKNDVISENVYDTFDLINNALIYKSKYLMNDAENIIEKLLF